ncbi:hypothetical protein [Halocatena salina]|uniref:Uncharacterized protein n=1 Tax=Halocatena salina TaxID=2934340 RepID=A0A8U0A565_9EURY|nr:hypothetical protein [Halocatena salina]UPM43608.1 hypothetical protein MW046_03960 [Halocatena salina]
MKMSIDRLKRRVRSVGTFRAALACVFSLLLVTSGSLVFVTSAQESPDGVDDRATFTVRTGAIHPNIADGGQICAEKIESDVNKVTVSDSTLKDVDIYLGKEGSVESHISFPSGDVSGDLVLYTNGENPLVNTLATLGICLPPGVPNPLPTTLKAYWLGVDNLETEGLSISSGGEPPSVNGPELSEVLSETNTSRSELGINNSTETNDTNETLTNTTNTTNETLTNATNTTNETLTNTTNTTNETLTNATNTTNETLTNTTNTTNETLTNTTNTTNETLTNTTDETTPVESETSDTTAPTTTESDSWIFSQGNEARTESTSSVARTTKHDRTDRNVTASDEPEAVTESPSVPNGTPLPTPTDDEEDGILSGILGPLFG